MCRGGGLQTQRDRTALRVGVKDVLSFQMILYTCVKIRVIFIHIVVGIAAAIHATMCIKMRKK